MIRVSKERLLFLALMFGYSGLLVYEYYRFIAPVYAYEGFVWHPRSVFSWGMGILLLVAFALFLPLENQRVSDYVLNYLFFFTYVPVLVLFLGNATLASLAFYLLTVQFLTLYALRRVRFSFSKAVFVGMKTTSGFALPVLVVGGASVAAISLLVVRFGLPRGIPSPAEAYTVRARFVSRGGPVFQYALIWSANVFLPFLLAYGVIRRKYWWSVGAIAGLLYLYSIAGFKHTLAVPAVILALLWWLTRYRQTFWLKAVMGLIGLLVVVGLSRHWTVWGVALLMRRVFFIPAQLHFYYVAYFTLHPLNWFSAHAPFRWWMLPRYPQGIPYVIGAYFFNRPSVGANANIFASFFADAGFWGSMVFPFLLALFLQALDIVFQGKDLRLALALLAIPTFAMTNSEFFTVMLTHGFAVAAVIGLFCVPYPVTTGVSALRRLARAVERHICP